MDPSILAAISGALTVLSAEVAKGTAGAAGKDAWNRIKGLLGSESTGALEQAQSVVSKQLAANPDFSLEVLALLKSSNSSNVGRLVGSITAEKVVVADNINNVNM
ncbi:MAG TPA: hypothetical protein VE961_25645 [Pyrinomonadaceae bacterium]|nr:hypothetical protein [Pyrinomonadaceae bacterium]